MPVETTTKAVFMQRITGLAESAHHAVEKRRVSWEFNSYFETNEEREFRKSKGVGVKGGKVFFFHSTPLPVSKIISQEWPFAEQKDKPNNPTSCHSANIFKETN